MARRSTKKVRYSNRSQRQINKDKRDRESDNSPIDSRDKFVRHMAKSLGVEQKETSVMQ